MKKWILSFIVLIIPMLISAKPVEVDGIWYNIVTKTKVAEVVNPNDPYGEYYKSSVYSGAVTIPSSFELNNVTYVVTSIGKSAFRECSITSVSIPNSVTSIGISAFYGCGSLTSIIIPSSITTISETAFKCSGLISVTIPEGVTSIEDHAFESCGSLSSLTIPSSLSNIGFMAFHECRNLTYVNIHDIESWCKTNINGTPFEQFYHLYQNGEEIKDLVIPNNVTIVGYQFKFCSSLTSITIGEGVYVGENAFAQCYELTDVYCLSDNIPLTGNDVFKGSNIEYATLHVPAGSVNAYQAVEPWCNFNRIIDYDEVSISTNSIRTYSSVFDLDFTNVKGLTAYIIGDYNASEGTLTLLPVSTVQKGEGLFLKGDAGEYVLPHTTTDAIYSNYLVGVPTSKRVSPTDGDYTNFIMADGSNGVNFYVLSQTENIPSGNAYLSLPTTDLPNHILSNTNGWKDYIFSFRLTYTVDGEIYKTVYVEEGEVITPEDEPAKGGYTFSGWSEIPETMPSQDVTVTGTFTVNKYKLTYVVDEVEYKTYEIDYGSAITPEVEPTKEGYTFSGWSEIPETMPSQDVTVTGSFTINNYKLTYKVDDKEYKSCEIEYGASITPEAAPTKEGYTFSGWSEIPETMPANDVTITGTFTFIPLGKCATPSISMKNGKIIFECETEGVEYVPQVIPLNETFYSNGEMQLPNKYRITVYATKEQYDNSDVATKDIELSLGSKGDVNGDGDVNVADHVELSNIIMGQK